MHCTRLQNFVIYSLATACLAVTSLAADPVDPTVGEWKTFGNGPSHTGYYPANIGNVSIAAGWTKSFGVTINQVAVSGNKIFLTTNPYFANNTYAAALSTADGSELWRYPLPQAYSLN